MSIIIVSQHNCFIKILKCNGISDWLIPGNEVDRVDILLKLGTVSTSHPTSPSTFVGRPVSACAFLRPLGALNLCAAG